jgi:phenol 2-monooxygenase (NADPH)
MQFHFNGFQVGDPDISIPSEAAMDRAADPTALPAKTDVLIVGCGPAGLTLAAQLSAFPDVETCIVERKPGPLSLGQADGIACRSVEMFHAFGFSEQVLREAYWVNETTFWRPAAEQAEGIVRGGRIKDTEPGLSEFPHVILNQARVHEFYLEVMRKSPNRLEPRYSWAFAGYEIDAEGDAAYPLKITLDKVVPEGKAPVRQVVRAKYAVGCDGARSQVRQAMGLSLEGDSANQAWGVMDVLPVSNFPDLRKKTLVRAPGGGSIVLIPREGGFLTRMYVELDKLGKQERVSQRDITLEQMIAAAKRILTPYTFEVKDVAWWSVYEIGQRLCPRFDNATSEEELCRVFIAGDACHTHSPKAGQGMNVSMQDGFNLGWKLGAVLRGVCSEDLLKTYSSERHSVAGELIAFDREWAAMLSAPLKDPGEMNSKGVTPEEIQDYFVRQGRYTAGTATRYTPSVLTGKGKYQNLAAGFPIGMRLHSAPVIRLADARPMHLGHTIVADGRWRVFVFADAADPTDHASALWQLCDFLDRSPASPIRRYTANGADIDSLIDLRAVFQQGHHDLAIENMHPLLRPAKGRFGLPDPEKIFCSNCDDMNIFDVRGIDRAKGCIVIVRPDQYVAHVLPLNASGDLSTFFENIFVDRMTATAELATMQ